MCKGSTFSIPEDAYEVLNHYGVVTKTRNSYPDKIDFSRIISHKRSIKDFRVSIIEIINDMEKELENNNIREEEINLCIMYKNDLLRILGVSTEEKTLELQPRGDNAKAS
jgi:hypothetical protein